MLVSGDDGHELIRCIVAVEDFIEASRIAGEIATLVVNYEQSDYTQLMLRGWQIDVTMSAPKGAWWSQSQQELAADIRSLFEREHSLEGVGRSERLDLARSRPKIAIGRAIRLAIGMAFTGGTALVNSPGTYIHLDSHSDWPHSMTQ